MKKILVLHTGGTIAMHAAEDGDVEVGSINPLNQAQFDFPAVDLEIENPFNIPSEHITPEHMLTLYNRLKDAEKDYDGVVITHGTDTLEETSFFLDKTLDLTIPVVMTGAMRSSNELGSDGLYNFQSALRVAMDEEADNRGVMVVLNDEIHAARFVTKTHATNVATFASPISGPMGMITKRQIIFFYDLPKTMTYPIASVTKKIPVMKAYAGMDGQILSLFAETEHIDGIIIEALGAGNLGEDAARGVQELLDADIPVVIVSRSFNGLAEPVYDYLGGGIQLEREGAIFARAVNGQKARLKLLIGLENGLSKKALKDFLNEF